MKSELCNLAAGIVCAVFTVSSVSFSGNILTDAVNLETIPVAGIMAASENRNHLNAGEIYEQELVISVNALAMGESVTIRLQGQPGQSFNGTFDFSESDIQNGIDDDDFNAPAEQLDENGVYEFEFEAPWDMNAFTLHIAYTGEPMTYTMWYSWEEEPTEQGKNLSIPVKELSRNNTVSVVLTGTANQTFQPSFDFSEADLNMGIGGLVSTKEMTLDGNGRFEFKFTAPWAMDAFAFNIDYTGSEITYEISYPDENTPAETTAPPETTPTETTTTTTETTTTAPEQTPTQTKTFVNGEDNWSFDNSDQNFPKGYYIKDTYLEKLLDGLSHTEKESILELLDGYWAGSCYGLASTSILAANDILHPSLWQTDAQVLYDIKAPISDDTTSLINYYFALQDTDFVQQEICKNFYNDDESEKIQQLLDCLEDGSPVLLCYHGYFYGYSWGGHAVVAYDVEQDGYTIDGEYFDTKIVTYDNNAVDYNANYCMYINTSDNTWIIPGYYLDSRYDARLGLIADQMDIINYHGYLDNDGNVRANGSSSVSYKDYIATMNSNAVTSKFSVRKISLDEDGYTINSNADDEIKMFSSLGDMKKPEITKNTENGTIGTTLKFAMLDSEAGYMMSLEESEPQNLNIRYENSLLHAKSSNSDTVIFDPSGYIEVDGTESDYRLSMTFNEGHYSEDWYKVSVLGKHADTVRLSKVQDGYLLEADNLRNVAVCVKNETLSFTRSFTADAQKALIYEIDENTIGIRIDADQDEQFESEITTYLSGDINSDDAINAGDASAILTEAAVVGSGLDGIFSTEQGNSADVNGDGEINAGDAADILCYAAYVGIGGEDSLPVYLDNDNN